ncbi:MAG TPA: hypothetical protein DEB74_16700 [Lachnospiraceae bacterium]|nr:hypothetical protein [Lachnospiraceae bacterium]
MTTRKCVICNEILDEQGVQYKGRYAHQKCFNIAMKTLQKEKNKEINKVAEKKKVGRKAKPKAELKKALSEEEYRKKQQYYNYLRGLIDGQELSAKIYALTEDYIERYKFTYESMYKTLVYLHEIIEKELIGDVVGIIPYYHSEAAQYYESIDKVAELNKDIDISKMYKEKTILIQPKKKKIKQIDIESIGKGVD